MNYKDLLIAIFVIILWSSNLIVQKIAVEHISIYLLNFLRLAFVAPLVIFYIKQIFSIPKYFVCGLFWNVINFVLIGYGLKAGVGAGLSSFLILTNSLFGVLFCVLLLREKAKLSEIIGMGVAFIGVVCLSFNSIDQKIPILGVIMLLGASISWGLGFALIKKFRIGRTMGDNVWLSAISMLPLLMFCFAIDGPKETFQGIIHISWISLGCILFASVISTIIAGYLWLNLSQRVRSSSMMPFMLLLPVFSCILSWLFLNETFSSMQLVSGFIIFTGVFITQSHMNYEEINRVGVFYNLRYVFSNKNKG